MPQCPTDNLPPGPYAIAYSGPATNGGHRYMVIRDAGGRTILSLFGKQREREALAALIINSRNATLEAAL